MIDEFFGFAHGELPYRALRFQAERLAVPRFQEVAVVNYPNEHEFTRITEFKHMTGQIHPRRRSCASSRRTTPAGKREWRSPERKRSRAPIQRIPNQRFST
jgi:UDP-galactopyranose mutase